MNTHTKGEWKVVNIGHIKRVRQSTKTICDCYSFSEGISDEEAQANAELIVKAVNERQALLDVMQDVLDDWHSKYSNFSKKEPAYLNKIRQVLKDAGLTDK